MTRFAAFALVGLVTFAGLAAACPFCATGQKTLIEEAGQAHVVLFGTMSNAQRGANGDDKTDLEIELVVKDHDMLKDKKKLVIPRFVPPFPKKTKHLVFCEVYKGNLDPYRGIEVPADSKIGEFMKDALALRDKDANTRLQFLARHFDANDLDVSGDAFNEFGKADYKDVRAAAAKMDPDRLLKLLKDPGTAPLRYGLVGLLLGHCGKADTHGKAIRDFLKDPKVRQASGQDGLFAGYVLLDPKGGLEFLGGLINNPKEDFLVRYAALRTLRFFHDDRPDVVSKDAVVTALKPLLEQKDINDLLIDDLRKWKRRELTPTIVGLFDKPEFDVPIIRRSIIKFALDTQDKERQACEFVDRLKKDKDMAELVREVQDLLDLEKPRPAATAAEAKPTGGK